MKITLKRNSYSVRFRHPLQGGRLIAVGLGADQAIAESVAAEIELLRSRCAEFPNPFYFTDGEWSTDQAVAVQSARLAGQLGFSARAVSAFLGAHIPDDVPQALPWQTLIETLCQQSPEAFKFFKSELPALQAQRDALLQRCDRLEREVYDLRIKCNIHCVERLSVAVDVWQQEYQKHHARKTYQDCYRVVKIFSEHLGASYLLRDVRTSHIQDFFAQYTDKRGKDVSARTIRKNFAYLSTFFSWAYITYDLSQNPSLKARPPKQKTLNRNEITAFRSQAELLSVVEALKPYPYWQAWVAVAVLAGPRFGEQCRLRIGDYSEEFNRLTIFGRKTGHIRHTPVELTTLKPILQAWILERKRQQRDPQSHPALQSDLMFPSLLKTEARTVTEAHIWSGGTKFLKVWRPVRDAVKGAGAFWSFTPRDWRHCAASAMGASGKDSGRISAWLGNTEGMARRHYVLPPGAKEWTFNWGG